MSRASEYLLKAENYALAAKLAEGRKRLAFLAAAAYWRNRAFDQRIEGFKRLQAIADTTAEPVKTAD